MHDSTHGGGLPYTGNDDIDPAVLEAIRAGRMTVEEALALRRSDLLRDAGLATDTPRPWTRPSERPFTRAERDRTTVLFGGLTWKHERLIQANLRRLGYDAAFLPAPDNRAYEVGKEYSNNGLCNPTYFTVGNLIAHLLDLERRGMSREEIIERHVFFTAGACGPCRFGMYESEYRLALRNAGFEGFRVLILQQQGGLDQAADGAGLEMNIDFTLGIINAFIIADVLNDIAYRSRPYEVEPGATDAALARAMEEVATSIEALPIVDVPRWIQRSGLGGVLAATGKFAQQLFGRALPVALRRAARHFESVELDRTRVKPVVKITGEFWAQTTEGDGNFRMFRFLEQEGAEVLIEPVTPWLMYLLHQEKQARRDRRLLDARGPRDTLRSALRYLRAQGLLTLAERLYAREYRRHRKALHNLPQAMPDQYHFARIAAPYFNTRIEGGEGHLEVAKTIYYPKAALCHMVLSLKPFGCLPSTQSDGVQSAVVAHHPDVLFLPIETSGEGALNAHSRVQMTLADARERAREEMDRVLRAHELTIEELRAAQARRADLRSPLLPLQPDGTIAGTAARFAKLVATRGRKRRA